MGCRVVGRAGAARYRGRVPQNPSSRPAGVLAAVAASLALAVFFVVMAVLSLSSGHGSLSGGVTFALVLWAVLVGASAVMLWRRAGWSRGPVIAAGLLHVLAFGQFTLSAPAAVLGALAGVIAVAGAVLPSTRTWLTTRGRP